MRTVSKTKYMELVEGKLVDAKKRLAVLITERSPSAAESQHDAIRENTEREIVAMEEVIKGLEQFKNFLVQSEKVTQIEDGAEFSISLNGEKMENIIFSPISVALEGIQIVTVKSPLGTSLLGKKQGQDFSYKIENGEVKGRVEEVN